MTDKPWRLARSLQVLLDQINAAHPKRSKASDGTIADQRHRDEWEANKKKDPNAAPSDHIPDARGIVRALDLTNDPPHEVHAALIAEAIRQSRDHRVAYLIFNGFMLRSYDKPGIPAWTWAPYTGASSHPHHVHVSVTQEGADDPAVWQIASALR